MIQAAVMQPIMREALPHTLGQLFTEEQQVGGLGSRGRGVRRWRRQVGGAGSRAK